MRVPDAPRSTRTRKVRNDVSTTVSKSPNTRPRQYHSSKPLARRPIATRPRRSRSRLPRPPWLDFPVRRRRYEMRDREPSTRSLRARSAAPLPAATERGPSELERARRVVAGITHRVIWRCGGVLGCGLDRALVGFGWQSATIACLCRLALDILAVSPVHRGHRPVVLLALRRSLLKPGGCGAY